jgi:hypothetical protein
MADDWTQSYDDYSTQQDKTAQKAAQAAGGAASMTGSMGGTAAAGTTTPSYLSTSAPQSTAPSSTPAPTTSQPSYASASAPQQTAAANPGAATSSSSLANYNDQQARGIYSDLSAAGHDVSWSGNQLMVDGRPYDVTAGGGSSSAMSGDAAPASGMQGITDPSVSTASTPSSPSPSSPSTGGVPSYSGSPTDRSAILAWIGQLASQPGADPSLGNDPNYWADRIIEKGGLTSANTQYWHDAGVGPTAFFNNPGRESGGNAGGTSTDFTASYVAPTLGTTALPSSPNLPNVTDPNANWNPSYSEPTLTAPNITPYAAPTAPWGASGPTSYAGGTVDTSDIPNFTPESLLQQQQGAPSAQSLDKLVTGLTDSQGPLDQRTIDTIKAQQKDALAEQAKLTDENIKGMGGSLGIGDSPWLAAQRASNLFTRDQSIASSSAAEDVDAAKTNYAAKQANAQTGISYQNTRTAQLMQSVDAGLQRATVTGNRESLQASIDQAAAASGQTSQQIAVQWLQHNVDAATAKELAAAGINLNFEQLQSANANHLMDVMTQVQQIKSQSSIAAQTANLNATLQKYGLDLNSAIQMNAQQLQKYGIDQQTQLQLIQLKQQNAQFGANYGLNLSQLQENMTNDDWMHSYMDTSALSS